MSDDVFKRYSAYYDLLYHDKDYAAEAEYVSRTLRSLSPDARHLLEFGSGTGRHGRLLAAHGFDIVGVERSNTMAAASAAGPSPSARGSFACVQGDIRTATLGRSFDAVVALFHVLSYQTRNVDLAQTFANAARHLRPGGVFLFDVWHGPAVLTERPVTRIKRVENQSTRLIRIAEPTVDLDSSVVTVRYTILAESKADDRWTTFEEEHRMRYLFPVEIALFCEQAGLELERTEEFLTGIPPTDRTWGVAYLFRKRL